jgi:hypothetical protein
MPLAAAAAGRGLLELVVTRRLAVFAIDPAYRRCPAGNTALQPLSRVRMLLEV